MKLHPAALDPAHIQNIIDQTQQMIPRIQDLVQTVPDPLLIFQMSHGYMGKSQDRIHRCPDVMGHIRKEDALGVVGVSGPLQRVFQQPPLLLFTPALLCDISKTDDDIRQVLIRIPDPQDLCADKSRSSVHAETECKVKIFLFS